jgi:hypothetical protein
MEEQGSYHEYFKGSKLRRSRTVDPSHKGRWIYTRIPISGFRGWKSRKLGNGNREITKREIPKAKRIVWATGVSEVDRWRTTDTESTPLTISEIRGVKFRKHCIRIRDTAKSEIPTDEVKQR